MRFTLPVLDASEVQVLAQNGADELYCGYMDSAWRRLYGGDATASRRQGAANLSSPQALQDLAEEAKRLGVPVHLALNARVTGAQLPLLIGMAEQWAGFGGSGIILQDPLLLRQLRHLHVSFTVSLLAETVNRYAAAFWRDLGADRMVLPRALRMDDMASITRAVPELCYEAMVMGDLCPFADGYCRSVHAESFQPAEPEEAPAEQRFTYNPSGCAWHLCMEYGAPAADPCAACSLARLEESGITVGKIGGRGIPLKTRLNWLRFMRSAALSGTGGLPVLYRQFFGHGCRCYYPSEEKTP